MTQFQVTGTHLQTGSPSCHHLVSHLHLLMPLPASLPPPPPPPPPPPSSITCTWELSFMIKIPKETKIPSSRYRGCYVGHKRDIQVKIKFSEHMYNYYSIFPISRKRNLAEIPHDTLAICHGFGMLNFKIVLSYGVINEISAWCSPLH